MSPHDALMALGWWICHQDPARTQVLGGIVLPMCVRCTGLYLFMGLVMWVGLLAPPPTRHTRALLVAAGAALAGSGILLAQWTGAQVGLWESNASNRLLTGLVAGAGLGSLLHVAFSLRLRDRGSTADPARARPRMLLASGLLAALSVAALALLWSGPPWPAAGWLVGLASLGGFYTASAWGLAVVYSYVFRRSSGEPSRLLVAAATAVSVLAQAAAMSVLRI